MKCDYPACGNERETGELYCIAHNRKYACNSQTDKERIEQLECQLAGCMTAAMGWAKDPPKKGDWGWSASFEEVLKLRQKYEFLLHCEPQWFEQAKAKVLNVSEEIS